MSNSCAVIRGGGFQTGGYQGKPSVGSQNVEFLLLTWCPDCDTCDGLAQILCRLPFAWSQWFWPARDLGIQGPE